MKKITALQRHPLVIACALAAAGAVLFVSEASYWRSTTTLQELTEMGMARTQIQTLERSMLDAETGQRGYLLTQRKEYLEPYATALIRIEDAYKVLDAYYGSDPESQALLQRLHTLTETKLSELALTLQLFDEGRGKAGREILMTDIGREKMDAIRATSAELLAYQTRAVSDSRSALISTLVLDRLGVAVLSLVSLLALFLYLRQSQALKLQQMELQRVVQLERDRLEVEVAHQTAELIELAQHLQTAREDERQRLARNLHDDLGSLLTSAKLDAARIKSRITVAAPEALDLLAHLVGTLNTGIALGRRIIEDLRPSSLSNLGLVAALEILAREYAAPSGVAVHCQLEPVALRPSAELVVYRLVQEAITNIAKYAQARTIWIELCTRAGQVEVSVRDDGVGFDTGTKPTSAYGLVGMRFRVGAEGGSLQLQSRPGHGTQILARFPPLSSTAG